MIPHNEVAGVEKEITTRIVDIFAKTLTDILDQLTTLQVEQSNQARQQIARSQLTAAAESLSVVEGLQLAKVVVDAQIKALSKG